MRQIVGHLLVIVSVTSAVMLTNLGGARLWDRDEPRNAGCAAEMMARGDYVTPIFNDELRDAKPVLLYWLIIASYQLFGVSEFAARFPNALLAIGTVTATYFIGRRLLNARAALWSALILATCLMFGVAGRAATPDSPLIFCSTLALMVFVLATFRRRENADEVAPAELRDAGHYFPQRWWLVALMFALMGVGILAKGPVGLVLPTAVIGMFLLIMRLPQRAESEQVVDASDQSRWQRVGNVVKQMSRPFHPKHFFATCWYMRPITAIVIALAVAAPWYILVGLRTEGDFLEGFFIKEHFGRATTAMENHRGPIVYYPLVILLCFFPWSIFIVPTLIELVRRIRRNDAWSVSYVFLACWVCVYVGLFTLAKTKLPSYITPCYPALALLTGGFMYHFVRGNELVKLRGPRVAFCVLGGVGAAILLGVPFAAQRFIPGHHWLALLGLVPLVGAIVGWLALQRNRAFAGAAMASTAICFAVGLFGIATNEVSKHQHHARLFEAIELHGDNPSVASYGVLESTWVYYTDGPVWELSGPNVKAAPEQNAAKVFARDKPWHRKPRPELRSFFAATEQPFLITTEEHLPNIQKHLPEDVQVLEKVPYFMKDKTLLLLGRPAEELRVARQISEMEDAIR